MPRLATAISAENLKVMMEDYIVCVLHPMSFSNVDGVWDTVHATHAPFFTALLRETPALNEKVVQDALPQKKFSKAQRMACSKHLCAAFSDLLAKRRNRRRYKGEARKDIYRIIFAEDLAEDSAVSPAKGTEVEQVNAFNTPPRKRICRKSSFNEMVCVPESAGTVLSSNSPASRVAMQVDSPAGAEGKELVSFGRALQPAAEKIEFAALPSWWDAQARGMRVLVPHSADAVLSKAVAGPNGFILAEWPDGTVQETSVSNLALSAPSAEQIAEQIAEQRAATKKRPGAALTCKPAAAGSALLRRPSAAASAVPAAVPAAVSPAEGALAAEAEKAAPKQQQRKQLSKTGERKRGEGVEPVLYAQHPKLGDCKTYMGPDKAYVQYWSAEKNSWKSVVNLAAGASKGRHRAFCRTIFNRLRVDADFSLLAAEALKKELLNS